MFSIADTLIIYLYFHIVYSYDLYFLFIYSIILFLSLLSYMYHLVKCACSFRSTRIGLHGMRPHIYAQESLRLM